MREIKFRVWSKTLNAMFWFDVMWGNRWALGDGWFSCVPWGEEKTYSPSNIMAIDPQEAELMQFTGLHDKNGKEIWEGDVLTYGYYEDHAGNDDQNRPINFPVKWSLDDCGFVANGRLIPHDGEKYGGNIYPFEVIGNIYENPELMEESIGNS
jgi:uncharacterized phage protein (TIGR01671 family)